MPNKDDHKSGASEPSGPGDKLSHYKIGDQVGKGAFGVVFKALSNIDGKTYVMKNISVGHMSTEQQQHAMQEVDVLKRCDHPHIIKYYASFIQSKQLHIVMEYAECGDLQKLIDVHRRRNDQFSEERLWRFCKEMCSALTYLHSKNIIHRDLKPLNIFLDKDKSVKVGDLGVSKSCNEMDMTHSRVGTPLYLAPEQIKKFLIRHQLACSLVPSVFVFVKTRFHGENLITLGYAIVKKKPRSLPRRYSNEWKRIIEKCLTKKASARPSASHCLLNLIPQKCPDSPLNYDTDPEDRNSRARSNSRSNSADKKKQKRPQSAPRMRPTDKERFTSGENSVSDKESRNSRPPTRTRPRSASRARSEINVADTIRAIHDQSYNSQHIPEETTQNTNKSANSRTRKVSRGGGQNAGWQREQSPWNSPWRVKQGGRGFSAGSGWAVAVNRGRGTSGERTAGGKQPSPSAVGGNEPAASAPIRRASPPVSESSSIRNVVQMSPRYYQYLRASGNVPGAPVPISTNTEKPRPHNRYTPPQTQDTQVSYTPPACTPPRYTPPAYTPPRPGSTERPRFWSHTPPEARSSNEDVKRGGGSEPGRAPVRVGPSVGADYTTLSMKPKRFGSFGSLPPAAAASTLNAAALTQNVLVQNNLINTNSYDTGNGNRSRNSKVGSITPPPAGACMAYPPSSSPKNNNQGRQDLGSRPGTGSRHDVANRPDTSGRLPPPVPKSVISQPRSVPRPISSQNDSINKTAAPKMPLRTWHRKIVAQLPMANLNNNLNATSSSTSKGPTVHDLMRASKPRQQNLET